MLPEPSETNRKRQLPVKFENLINQAVTDLSFYCQFIFSVTLLTIISDKPFAHVKMTLNKSVIITNVILIRMRMDNI